MEVYSMQIIVAISLLVIIMFFLSISKLNKKMLIAENSSSIFMPWREIYKKIHINKIYSLTNDIVMFFCLGIIGLVAVTMVIDIIAFSVMIVGIIILVFSIGGYPNVLNFGQSIFNIANIPLKILNYQNIITFIVLILVYLVNIYPFYKLCLSFDKKKSVSIFFSLVWPISLLILAFDNSKYNTNVNK